MLERIQKVQCSQEFNESNFRLVDYKDSKGERRPLIVMTKLGMMFLVTGFTGKKAETVREAFVCEFDRRAEIIRQQKEENIELRRRFEDLYTLVSSALEQGGAPLPPETDAEVSELKMRLESLEQQNSAVHDNTEHIKNKVEDLNTNQRRDPSKKTKQAHLDVIIHNKYGFQCPC